MVNILSKDVIEIKKSTLIRIFSFFSAGILVLCGMLIKEKIRVKEYKLQVQNEYSRSLSELNAQLNSISLILEKTVYTSGGEKLGDYASQLFCEATIAKNCVSSIPRSERLETVNRFLSQVGNYALSISKNSINGQEISEEQRNNLKKLSDTAKTISEVLNNTQIMYNNPENLTQVIEERLTDEIGEGSLASTLTELEENLTDYPTLLYDGPYSDHIINKKPLMTSNAYEVSKEDAQRKAIEFFSLKKASLTYDGFESGKIDGYRFTSGETSITISKNGGYPIYMRNARVINGSMLSYEKALERAKEFLDTNGLENMRETYYYTDEGVCVINFAFLDGQTLCYTDLIKVGVAVDNGEIVFYEASGYLTNHTERSFVSSNITASEAAESISKSLTIEKTTVTLIPTDGGSEVRCYEFLCNDADGREILIYINLLNGKEEQLFILLKTDNGILAK